MPGRGSVREMSGEGIRKRDVRERRCQGNGISGKQDVRELDVKE